MYQWTSVYNNLCPFVCTQTKTAIFLSSDVMEINFPYYIPSVQVHNAAVTRPLSFTLGLATMIVLLE